MSRSVIDPSASKLRGVLLPATIPLMRSTTHTAGAGAAQPVEGRVAALAEGAGRLGRRDVASIRRGHHGVMSNGAVGSTAKRKVG